MDISIITPSFRNSRWLKLCIQSVADQGVDLEHIVQDSCSDDGTQDWLLRDSRVKAYIEKDSGMYDAVNRGLRRSQGEICAYLNCDEQYLPGALSEVLHFFDLHRDVDVLFADAVVTDRDGNYLCHRKAKTPTRDHTLVSGDLAILTCSTFFRRAIFEKHGLYFNPELRIVGDAEWISRMIDRRISMALIRRFTSAFMETGANLSTSPSALDEKKQFAANAPWWARKSRLVVVAQHRLGKLLTGHYWQVPFDYSIYTEKSPTTRVRIPVKQPTTRWRR